MKFDRNVRENLAVETYKYFKQTIFIHDKCLPIDNPFNKGFLFLISSI